jgi:E3 ubiquitin-protein ligase BRE1
MLEFKREKATLESQLRDVQKRAADHDDHLRVVDAWWTQVCFGPRYSFGLN